MTSNQNQTQQQATTQNVQLGAAQGQQLGGYWSSTGNVQNLSGSRVLGGGVVGNGYTTGYTTGYNTGYTAGVPVQGAWSSGVYGGNLGVSRTLGGVYGAQPVVGQNLVQGGVVQGGVVQGGLVQGGQVLQSTTLAPTTQVVGQSVVGGQQLAGGVVSSQFVGSQVGWNGGRSSIRGESYFEYIPQEKSYVEQVAQTRVEYVPVERRYTDYQVVEYQTEYVPQSRYETFVDYHPVVSTEYDAVTKTEYVPVEKVEYVPRQRTDYVGVERVEEKVDYQAVTRQVVHGEQSGLAGSQVLVGGQQTLGSQVLTGGVLGQTQVLPQALPQQNLSGSYVLGGSRVVQGGLVQGGLVQGGLVQGGLVQGGLVQGGLVQQGGVVGGLGTSHLLGGPVQQVGYGQGVYGANPLSYQSGWTTTNQQGLQVGNHKRSDSSDKKNKK